MGQAYNGRAATKKNKSKQAQLLRYTAAAVQSSGWEVIDDATEKDDELVPTRMMVKHKAKIEMQKFQRMKKAEADA